MRPEDRAIHPGLTPMQQQLIIYAIRACSFSSPWSFATYLAVDLASSYLQVLTSVQSSICCQHISSIQTLTIAIFSLVWGRTPAYSLWPATALCCSDGWARISLALFSVAVILHIAVPYNNTDRTFELRMRNMVFLLNLPDYQMFSSLVNAVLVSTSRLLIVWFCTTTFVKQ